MALSAWPRWLHDAKGNTSWEYSLCLSSAKIADVLVILAGYVKFQQARIRAILMQSRQHPEGMEWVSLGNLISRMNDGTVVLLNLRPDEEFAQSHLSGAFNVPIEQLAQRISKLSTNTEVIVHCKGRYCVLTMEAVNILRARGKRASLLAGGELGGGSFAVSLRSAAQKKEELRPPRRIGFA